MDKVFLADPVDTYYQARREHGIVVSMACHRPEETCFCSTFGIDATKPEGDVVTWIAEDTLYWEAQTEKGEGLTKKVEAVLAESDSKAVEAQQAAVKEILKKLPLADLDLSYFTSHPELEIFKREEWKELSSHCLGCGTCTFVCPTCQCYDVRDYDTGHGIERYRCWDSCMYRDFTMMAHGTNRKSQVERFRQRFMHKLVYNPLRNDGEFSCVGCGRCLGACNFDAIYSIDSSANEELDRKMAEYAAAVCHDRPCFHISLVQDISPNCDCHGENDAPILPDIGIFASFDPVALDQACVDACLNATPLPNSQLSTNLAKPGWNCYHDNFKDSNPNIEWKATLEQAEKIGMGTRAYTLKKV